MFSSIFSNCHFFLCFPQLFEIAFESGSEYFHSSLFTGTVLSALHVLTQFNPHNHLVLVEHDKLYSLGLIWGNKNTPDISAERTYKGDWLSKYQNTEKAK